MKRKFILAILLAAVFISLCGCKRKNEQLQKQAEATSIKIGHVGHDHHIALFVALDNIAQYHKESGINLKTIKDRKFYEMYDKGKKIADIEIVKVGGGSKMPTALAQDVIEVGFGGVAAVLAAADSGAPVKMISPLHYKGDMFVLRGDFNADNWRQFIATAKAAEKPLRIGYKNPVAVAKLVFEEALKHEQITFSGDLSRSDVQVHMVNTKGGGKLNVSLAGGLIDGYVGNNPFPAIAVEKKIGKVICDLEKLPPGTFRNHPCCCIAANTNAIEEKSEAIVDLLILFFQANETINNDLNKAVASATRWIGTSETVEKMSIPTSGYSMEATGQWHQTMEKWIQAMNGLDIFTGNLRAADYKQVTAVAYDLTLLEKARIKFAQRKTEK